MRMAWVPMRKGVAFLPHLRRRHRWGIDVAPKGPRTHWSPLSALTSVATTSSSSTEWTAQTVSPSSPASPANLDDVVDCEIDDALRAGKTARPSRIPIYGRTTGQLQRAAPRKIQEENAGPRIGFQIAERLKHAVSRVVRPREVTSADDVDEPRVATSMRSIGTRLGVAGGDEEGVRATDPVLLTIVEGARE